MNKKDKTTSLSEAVSLINDGDTVAVGGSLIRRHPMAIIYEMIRQGKKGLTLLGWNNAIDFDLLIGAGSTNTIETSYVGMAMLGLANNYRRGIQDKSVRIYEHSETTAIDAFRAGSMGWTFYPSKTPLGSGIQTHNDRVKPTTCPFTGEKFALLPAFTPDVAIIHAHVADYVGNVQLDPIRELDNEVDTLIAKSAKKVIVSVEQVVSEDCVQDNPHLTILPKFFVDVIVEAPFGAHPTACDCRYDYDLDFLREYHGQSKTPEQFQNWLKKYVLDVKDHYDYLDMIGTKHLLSIQRPKEVR